MNENGMLLKMLLRYLGVKDEAFKILINEWMLAYPMHTKSLFFSFIYLLYLDSHIKFLTFMQCRCLRLHFCKYSIVPKM